MTQTPTDALRLVPVEPTSIMTQEGLATLHTDGGDDMEAIRLIYRAMLAAAPASPLPGGGDWIDGTPEVPVGSPPWCGWASYEIRRLRAALLAAPTGEPK